jgi:phosphatidylglycerophosphate synthase
VLKTKYPYTTNKISQKIGLFFSKFPLTPNEWTVLSLFPAVLGFYALVYREMALGLFFFIVAGFFDAIDGAVARVTKKFTSLGGYLDGITDRLVEMFLLIGLMFFGLPDLVIFNFITPVYVWIALLLFVGSALVSYSRAYAYQKGVIKDEKILKKMPGVLERTERLWLIGGGMILFHIDPVYLTYVIFVAFFLSVITFLERVWFVVKVGSKKTKS